MGSQFALSEDDIAWCLNPVSSDPGLATRQLASAVIQEAISDIRTLREEGVLVGAEINPDSLVGGSPTDGDCRRLKRKVFTYVHAREVEELLEFFTGRQLESWLEAAQFDVTAAVIRDKMQL